MAILFIVFRCLKWDSHYFILLLYFIHNSNFTHNNAIFSSDMYLET